MAAKSLAFRLLLRWFERDSAAVSRTKIVPNLKGDIMEAVAVFIAFLAPFFALIAGLTLVTFAPLKRDAEAKKFSLTGLSVGGITALGWAPILLSGGISPWLYLGAVAIFLIFGTLIIMFVSSEMLTEKNIDEPTDNDLRARYDYCFRFWSRSRDDLSDRTKPLLD